MKHTIPFRGAAALAAALPLCLAGCSDEAPAPQAANATPVVFTTFYPTAYFTERIAGDLVQVVRPVPDGEDPIFWNPSREVLAEYQAADLIVVNGAEFEKWVTHASLPESRVVNSAEGLPEGFLTFEATRHRHGVGGEHTHAGIDGHTWVDPGSARYQVGRIAEALERRWPEEARDFKRNAAALQEDLDALLGRLSGLEPRVKQVTLLASHPAYDYLGRRLGWTIFNFALDPELLPDDAELEALTKKLEEVGDAPRVLLWEAEPLGETAELLRERFGIASVLFSPVELLDPELAKEGEDYLTIMNANVDRLAGALPR